LGVIPTSQALKVAEERGLDLVEVSPSAKPPVCRLMDYGRFRFQATRRERDARRENKSKMNNVMREIQLKTRIGEHDRHSKSRQIKRLLGEGAKVRVSIMFRGREITHPEIGMEILRSVAEDLADDANMEKPPSFEGRLLTMILGPSQSKPDKTAKPQKQENAKT